MSDDQTMIYEQCSNIKQDTTVQAYTSNETYTQTGSLSVAVI